MDGRKFDWIRQHLDLSKVELARQWQDNSGQKRTKLYVKAWEWAAIERARAELAKTAPEMER